MSEFSRLPPEQRVSGHASFMHRNTPWQQRLWMGFIDALMRGFGALLWLGGRPLRRGLIWLMSTLAWALAREKKRISSINLDLAYKGQLSEAEKQRIIRAMFSHFSAGVLDLLFDWVYWPPDKIAHYVTEEGRERLETLKQSAHGSTLVCCHLGNPDLALKLVRAVDFDVYAMYKGFKSPWFDRYIANKRLSVGGALIEVPSSRHHIVKGKRIKLERNSLRSEVADLYAQGHCVGFLADQHTKRGGIDMTVLGVPDTPTQTGAWRYVVEHKVPFIMLVTVYREDGGLDWRSSQIMQAEDQGDPQATLVHTIEKSNRWFEEQIRRNPEQYFWAHRRFARHHYEKQGAGKPG